MNGMQFIINFKYDILVSFITGLMFRMILNI